MNLQTWDGNNINDGTNYQAILNADAYGLPGVSAKTVRRQGFFPLIGHIDRPARVIHIDIYIRGTPVKTLQGQLGQWFDPDDDTPKRLRGLSPGAAEPRELSGICESLDEVPFSAGLHWVVSIRVEDDNLWREYAEETEILTVTSSGDSKVFANAGETDHFPRIQVRPINAKAAGYLYARFIQVLWRSDFSVANYPVDICNDSFDTDALQTAGKIQSDLDDLRVFVDGAEVPRWPNPVTDDATTKVWVNLNFAPQIVLTLTNNIGAGDTEIEVDESIADMPASGIIKIGTEVIAYGSKHDGDQEFRECERGAKYTTAASHSSGVSVYWLQHDIWIRYGNSAASAPDQDDGLRPQFNEATSTLTSHDYDEFTDLQSPVSKKSGQWQWSEVEMGVNEYSHNRGTATHGDYEEMGMIGGSALNGRGRWFVSDPCYITSINFANGEKYALEGVGELSGGVCEILKSPDGEAEYVEYQIPDVTAADTWESWSRNASLAGNYYKIILEMDTFYQEGTVRCEVADVTLTLNSSYTPQITIGAEQEIYDLDARIYNATTGENILIKAQMKLSEYLEIDTWKKTVKNNDNGENHFGGLTVVDGPRKHWLRFQPGNNTIYYYETGVTNLYLYVSRTERYYQ